MSGSKKVSKYKAHVHLVRVGATFGHVTGVMNRGEAFAYEIEGIDRLVGENEVESAYLKLSGVKRTRKTKVLDPMPG